MLSSGMLNERITLQKTVISRSDSGSQVITFSDIAQDLPASVRFAKGLRRLDAGEIYDSVTIVVTVRYSTSFLEADRLLWQEKKWTCQPPLGDRANGSVTITAMLYDEGTDNTEPEPDDDEDTTTEESED